MIPLKVGLRDEGLGLDVSQHGEEAYTSGEGAILLLRREPVGGRAAPRRRRGARRRRA